MRRGALLVLAVLVLFTPFLLAQRRSDTLQAGSQAAIIFRGQVVAVRPITAHAPDEVRATLVTLRVEDGVRGVARGETITIRQWNVDADEYRVGESLVLFLYAPSAQLGLTSPVAGRAGHLRVDEVPAATLDSLRTSAAPAPPDTSRVPPPSPRAPRRPKPRHVRAEEAER